jgi:succinate-acetate transporter protein
MSDLPPKTFIVLLVCVCLIAVLEIYALRHNINGVALSASTGVLGIIVGHATKYLKRGQQR